LNNIFYDNTAGHDGGALRGCKGISENNTVYGNQSTGAGYHGGGYALHEGPLRNNIIWANTASGDNQLYGSGTPAYCCIEDWSGGGKMNIALSPGLTAPLSEDFHLLPNSPCIDAGKESLAAGDFERDSRGYDGSGENRGDGSGFDIGADEFVIQSSVFGWQVY
jgi:hypothetical protein